MRFYGVMRTRCFDGTHDRLYVFDSAADRDRFLKTGERCAYELVVPWETFPVKASEAKKYASVDYFGDRYACKYLGGVEYPWGHSPDYHEWRQELDEARRDYYERRTACQHTS